MRVFVTGASGHVGSALVPELLDNGHEVVGLARSDSSAAALEAAGAQVSQGDLDDLDNLGAAATDADGVIHLAFKHDLMREGDMSGAAAADREAIDAIGDALAGTDKPFVTTGGTLLLSLGGGITDRPGTEEDVIQGEGRIANENATIALAERGVRSAVVRLAPTVHSDLDTTGFVPSLIAVAREKGSSGYIDDGANRWPAVNTRDAAVLYRLAVERAKPGTRLNAAAEEGVPFREIAEAVGRGLDVPVHSVAPDEAEAEFSFMAFAVGIDNPTSSALTRKWLGWNPVQATLLEDLASGFYFERGAN